MSTLSEATIKLLEQMEDLQILHDFNEEQLCKAATEETRNETFVKMYIALKEIKNGKA